MGKRCLLSCTRRRTPYTQPMPMTKPRQKDPRSYDGQPGAAAAALGESGEGTSRVLRMNLPSGRRTRHAFVHEVLPRAVSFASSFNLGRNIYIVGGDEGIGVALILLQLFFDDEGSRVRSDTMPGGTAVGQSSVRTRLEWSGSSRAINSSRTILKRVNGFLPRYITVAKYFPHSTAASSNKIELSYHLKCLRKLRCGSTSFFKIVGIVVIDGFTGL